MPRNPDNVPAPVYVVTVAGFNAYTINPVPWSAKTGSGHQLYQHISVSGESLNHTSWSASRVLCDSFTLIKDDLQDFSVVENKLRQ